MPWVCFAELVLHTSRANGQLGRKPVAVRVLAACRWVCFAELAQRTSRAIGQPGTRRDDGVLAGRVQPTDLTPLAVSYTDPANGSSVPACGIESVPRHHSGLAGDWLSEIAIMRALTIRSNLMVMPIT